MAISNEEMPEEVYLCNECDEIYHEETDRCDCGCVSFRIVSKGDLGYLD